MSKCGAFLECATIAPPTFTNEDISENKKPEHIAAAKGDFFLLELPTFPLDSAVFYNVFK